MEKVALAPILLFVFARPEHTQETLRCLARNDFASESDLIVYADGARNENEKLRTAIVRNLFRNLKGFRSVKLIEREQNYGLAKNIIEGVTEVCKTHGRVIVLEDDMKTAPGFLAFMNSALVKYENDQRVWHVSGWNYPIESSASEDAYFSRLMNCWGWATWSNRWIHYRNDPNIVCEFAKEEIKDFDLETGGVFWNQLLFNRIKLINTWAIYWYASIYKEGGLCINPSRTLVENIGLDGSGTNSGGNSTEYRGTLNTKTHFLLPESVSENIIIRNKIIKFYDSVKPSYKYRIKAKLSYWYSFLIHMLWGKQ